MLKPEMIVRFKPEYNGYFKHLKDKDLTVMQVFEPIKDGNYEDETKCTILEIEEIHLINQSHFVRVEQ